MLMPTIGTVVLGVDAPKSRHGLALLRREPPSTRNAATEVLSLVFYELTRRI